MSASTITLEDLRVIDLFTELTDEQLQEWADAGVERLLGDGDSVALQGVSSPGFQLILSGSVRAFLDRDPVGTHVAPTWIGAIPTLSENPMAVDMLCEGDCRIIHYDPEVFEELVFSHKPVRRTLMRAFGPVMTRISAREQNKERLAALGTMAAGLAHELNNPASAAKRAAADLADALEVIGSIMHTFVHKGIERHDAEQLVALQQKAMFQVCKLEPMDTLDAADVEDQLLEHLEDLGIEDAYKLAEPLASAHVDVAFVDDVVALAGPAAGAALEWIAASVTARSLAEDLRSAAGRMSELVGAVKTYAYMDRGERVEVDLHEGLETTLTVLGHKLKHTEIKIKRCYDKSLPRATVYGSELNQVWTNLLDNAIDALDGSGTITITTRLDGTCAEILIADDGPGMPPEVRDHVFDPFFTTKGVGAGTGLGLDTARRIVADRHDGSLSVESSPGSTVFTVRVPL